MIVGNRQRGIVLQFVVSNKTSFILEAYWKFSLVFSKIDFIFSHKKFYVLENFPVDRSWPFPCMYILSSF